MMSISEWAGYMNSTQSTYFPAIEFIDTQFYSGYHDLDGGYDFYINSL